MAFLTFIIVAGVVGFIIFAASRSRNENDGSWIQFFAKGKDAGFSFKELELLRRLAIKSNLEDPTALFWSQNQLDLCIRSLVRNMRMAGDDEDLGNQDFLSKLYDFRKKIEMDTPKIKRGISNSRQVSEGQGLRILVAGMGVFKSEIVKNTPQYITISRPVSNKVSPTFSWKNMKVSVYFWRQDDAGYVFDSEVIDEVFSKGISSLKIAHSDSLFRTQKRKSIRIKLHKAAFLYLLGSDEDSGRIEAVPGAKCFLEDLSDTGCAVTIGGKAVSGLRVKIQFALNNVPVCMGGTVRSVDFKEDANRSILHIEADTLSMDVRNKILGEVFGTMSDDDEELPFRILDDDPAKAKEGADATAQAAPVTGTAAPAAATIDPPKTATATAASLAEDAAFGSSNPEAQLTVGAAPPASLANPALVTADQDEPELVPFDDDAL